MFGIKTYLKTQLKKRLFHPQDTIVFPKKGNGWLFMKLRLWHIKRKLQKRDVVHNLGWLYTLPHPMAVNAYKYFLDQNPNHLGNWTTKESRPFATQELEREVVWKMIDLYHADKNKIEGYITSGATESNIFSTWVGRKYLEQYMEKSKICLLKTSLTHYSISKSADIVGIPSYISPLNSKEWNLDQRGLAKIVTRLYQKGHHGFLLPITLGYTETGTCDNIEETTKTVQYLQKKIKDVHFFLWIDAALNGLVAPFIDQTFTPFASSLIQTLVVDFHKFGLVPYPAGLVLYRNGLRHLIEKPVGYLPEKDNTFLGSRSGVSAAAIWTMINILGKSGYQNLMDKQLHNKRYFLKEIATILPNHAVVTHSQSLSCCILFPSETQLPILFENKYGLYFSKIKILFDNYKMKQYHLYKFYFLPYLKRDVISEFLQNLSVYENSLKKK